MNDKKDSKATEEKLSSSKAPEILKIKGSDEKPTYWKPEKPGQFLEGKLVAITEGNFGKVLKISTKKAGVVGVNVGAFLADIDFTEYQEMNLRFTFKGKVGSRGCRVFDVDRVLLDGEAPF